MVQQQIKKYLQYIGYLVCFILGLTLQSNFQYAQDIFWGQKKEIAYPNQTGQVASLITQRNLADINFIVKIDGKKIYRSPEYASYSEGWYQEYLQWDVTGKVLLLKLLGKRVFAYNTTTQKELRKGELAQYQFREMKDIRENYAPIKDIDE